MNAVGELTSRPPQQIDASLGQQQDIWGLSSEFAVLTRSWDEHEAVVYHSGSGDTHLADGLAGQIIAALQVKPATAAELCRSLGEKYGHEEADDDLCIHLRRIIQELHKLEILAPVRP